MWGLTQTVAHPGFAERGGSGHASLGTFGQKEVLFITLCCILKTQIPIQTRVTLITKCDYRPFTFIYGFIFIWFELPVSSHEARPSLMH